MGESKRDFGCCAERFPGDYLTAKKGCSAKTVSSHRDAIVLLIGFMQGRCGGRFGLADIDAGAVGAFLDHLEADRGNSVATRNQRQAAVNSFLSFVRTREPEPYGQYAAVLDIPRKKPPRPAIAYLTVAEVEGLFASIDESDRRGLRDKAMLAFPCETAARVDELCGCLSCQLRFESAPYVELHGKGGKARNVPVTESFAELVGDYAGAFGIGGGDEPPLANRYGRPLTQKGVAYVLGKRLAAAAASMPSIGRKRITCHSMRHSRATRLLEAGVNLIYIRDILGHASVTTTEIYAKTNPELKRKYLTEHSATYSTGEKYTPEERNDLVKWLKDNF